MERWETFLRTLGDRVAVASDKQLTARCWKSSTLRREITAVIKSKQKLLRTTFPPAHAVIEQLQRMGWIHTIKVQSPKRAGLEDFFLLDMEAAAGEPMNPLELLQACLPDGVVCYFSALHYHGLTTQVVAHHHIARLISPGAKRSLPVVKPAASSGKVVERNPLGTELFHFAGVGCYLSKRDASLAPGVQCRVVSPRCWLRITTLEQTLLDALMQPVRGGGAAVVMEAWETGAGQMDADRMAEHLAKIQREALDRRVGAVLDLIGANFAASTLGRRLEAVRNRLMARDVPEIPLLAGFEFPARNTTWRVATP